MCNRSLSQLNPKKSKDKTKFKDSKDKHVETVETDKCLTLTDLKADDAVSNAANKINNNNCSSVLYVTPIHTRPPLAPNSVVFLCELQMLTNSHAEPNPELG